MNLELYTERLHLRPYQSSDVDLDVEMGSDPAVMEYFGGVTTVEEIIAESVNFTRRCGGGCIGVWTVIDRSTQELFGEVFLTPLPIDADDTEWDLIVGDDIPDGEIELGYLFTRSTWGNGIATETCQRLLQFAFEETPLTEVVSIIEPGNSASENVLLKSGFVQEGMRRAYADQCAGFRMTREQYLVCSGKSVS